jgi:hypothetical protein
MTLRSAVRTVIFPTTKAEVPAFASFECSQTWRGPRGHHDSRSYQADICTEGFDNEVLLYGPEYALKVPCVMVSALLDTALRWRLQAAQSRHFIARSYFTSTSLLQVDMFWVRRVPLCGFAEYVTANCGMTDWCWLRKHFQYEAVIASLRYIDYSSRGSSVCLATGCELDECGSSTSRGKRYSLFRSVHTDCESHPTCNAMDTGGGDFLWAKAAGSWSCLFSLYGLSKNDEAIRKSWH